jgi:hypothetical protein
MTKPKSEISKVFIPRPKVPFNCKRHGSTLGYRYGKWAGCVICRDISTRKWAAKNPESVKASATRRLAKYIPHPREQAIECAKHGAATKWEIVSGRRRCRECRLAWTRKCAKRYRLKNLEKCKANSRKSAKAWALAHPDLARALRHKWEKAHPGAVRGREARRVAREKAARDDGSVKRLWPGIVSAYRGLCAYCPTPYRAMDHVIPVSRGGDHVASNVCPACTSCNSRKNASMTWTPRPWAAMVPGVDLVHG